MPVPEYTAQIKSGTKILFQENSSHKDSLIARLLTCLDDYSGGIQGNIFDSCGDIVFKCTKAALE